VIGTTIFLIGIGLYTPFIGYLQQRLDLNPEMTIAFAHGIFNVTNTIIQFPFIAALAWLVTKLVRGDDTKKHADMGFQIEEALNSLDRKITSYLVDISAKPLTNDETGLPCYTSRLYS
jgi:phosphate:Na+ symporter